MHRHGGLESQFDSSVTVRRVGLTTEEGCVSFDLDHVEALGASITGSKQFRGVYLGLRELSRCVRMSSA